MPEKVAAELEKAMEQEDNGYFDKAKDICEQILATEEGRNVEKVKLTLARIYPKVLETDIYDCNKRYQTDVEDYFKFLDSITMNDLMQEYVVETLAKFCELMEMNGTDLFSGNLSQLLKRKAISQKKSTEKPLTQHTHLPNRLCILMTIK